MRSFLQSCALWLHAFRKSLGAIRDTFHPSGYVELRLIHARGPKAGQVARCIKGRNVVTSWLSSSGAAPTSGRDLMRRIITPSEFSGSLAGDSDAVFKSIVLGSGTTPEVPTDTGLVTEIDGSEKSISSVEFDASNPYVTFIVEYDEGEVNQTISELAIRSGREDFLARKTVKPFTKDSDYTLQVRWQIRF